MLHVAMDDRRCDTLCTSGFLDDVMFSRNGLCGASCVFPSGESVTAETILHRFQPNFAQR